MKKNLGIAFIASAITMMITATGVSSYFMMENNKSQYRAMMQSYDGVFAIATMDCENADNEFLISKVQLYETTLNKYDHDYNNIGFSDYLDKKPLKEEILEDVNKRKQELQENDFANIIANKDYGTACTNISKMVASK